MPTIQRKCWGPLFHQYEKWQDAMITKTYVQLNVEIFTGQNKTVNLQQMAQTRTCTSCGRRQMRRVRL